MDKPAKPEGAESAPESLAPGSLPPNSIGAARTVESKIERRVFWACIASLVALGLIVWALIHPKPIAVIVAMSVGQVIGTFSFLLFLGSIALDLRARYKITQRSRKTPAPPPSKQT